MRTSRDLRPAADRQELIRLLPALGVLIVWVVLMAAAGGFNARDWMPAGLVFAGLLLVAMIGGGRVLPVAPKARAAVLALAAYTAWCLLSITWSAAPGESWDSANLLLVTLLSGWTIALVPWRPRTAEVGMLVLAVAAAVVCALTYLGALRADDVAGLFTDSRFNPPLDYPNTSAAFCVVMAIPALLLGARPGGGPAIKAVALTAGTFLLAFALLPQSRGSVLGAVAAVVVMLAVVPFRWRLLGALLTAAVGVGIAAAPVLDVYDVASAGGDVKDALASAGWALGASALVGALGGAALGLLERRGRPSESAGVRIRQAGWGLVGLVVLAVVLAGAANAGRIKSGVDDQLNSIRDPGTAFTGTTANPSGSNRLLAADPLERYDYWRVALDGLRDHPVGGLGTGGFDHAYTTERRYPKPSKYPHNLLLRVAGETGIVGLALFAGLLVALLTGLLRGIRTASRGERALSAAALATIAYVAVHASLDWLEAYPVITGPVLALALAALVARDRDRRLVALSLGVGPDTERRRRLPALPAVPAAAGLALGCVLAVAAAVSLTVPWLALRYQESAVATWRTDPTGAYTALRKATDLNPLGTAAPLNLGLIAVQRGDERTARAAFATALEREPLWLPHLELALLDRQSSDGAGAEREFDEALALAPREPALQRAKEILAKRGRLSAAEATRQVFDPE
jgi:hypothetical protein